MQYSWGATAFRRTSVPYRQMAVGACSTMAGMKDKIQKPEEEWKKELTPEQYQVCRMKGTERPFTGEYYKTKDPGVYKCAACGNELFESGTKYESGTGWPSFYKPIAEENVETEEDDDLGMRRTEVMC